MKQQDIAIIAAAVVASIIVSVFVSKSIFAPPKDRQQQVEQAQSISSNFTPPTSTYFNKNSIDPTPLITIGQNSNPNPFQ